MTSDATKEMGSGVGMGRIGSGTGKKEMVADKMAIEECRMVTGVGKKAIEAGTDGVIGAGKEWNSRKSFSLEVGEGLTRKGGRLGPGEAYLYYRVL